MDEGAVFAALPTGVARLLSDHMARGALRDAIIARYFPTAREALRRPSAAPLLAADAGADQSKPGRSAAFRRKVVEVYDHQCAACGLRLRPGDIPVSLVDAAHIVPFSRSGDDHPRNGMALCKNHHWAMDQRLIAPTPAGVWRSSPALVPRRSSGEADLARLDGKRLLPPREPAYRPRPEALAWRLERLLPTG